MTLKRVFDITLASFGLLLFAPLLGAAVLAVWLEDGQCPFYLARRLARGGGEFRMVKFRTMIPDAWKSGVNSTAAGDRRITRVGRWLRAAKLDELPQLWNVLSGDMSLVGPRPQVAADAALYTAVERRMLAVRPGITDVASIVFADEGRILAGSADPDLLYNQIIRPWKSRLALLSIERGSLASDALILLLTAVGAVSRAAALGGVAQILAAWNAEPQLLKVVRRAEPLAAWPPPGASRIVAAYPRPGDTGADASDTLETVAEADPPGTQVHA